MEKTFRIKGMHCDSCNWLISENVREVSGVKSVKADYKKGEVQVAFEPPSDEKKIISAIEKEGGYKVA
ncbi:MAG: heavy-metal-associated domain-containing protein [Candidatus Micrarchaeota archaeon]